MNNDLISRSALRKALEVTQYNDIDDLTRTERLIDNAPTVNTTCPNCDSGYAQGYSDGYLKGKEERPIDDLSEYSDKLWQKAYERGKAEGRPQGEWIGSDGEYQCNKCYEKRWYRSNYCPQCGAMMKEAENNES